MNWITIVVAGIFIICVIVGICRGAIKIMVSLVSTIITIALVFFLTPYASKAISSMTPADEVIEHQVTKTITDLATSALEGALGESSGSESLAEEKVRSVLNAAGITNEELAALGISVEDIAAGRVSKEELAQYGISRNLLDGLNLDGNESEEVQDQPDIPKELQTKAIENSSVPNAMKTLLLENNTDEVYEKLGAESFVGYVSKFISNMIINIVAFLFVFLIVSIILRAIIFALDIVSELPVLGLVNRLAGGVLGVAGALIIVWLIFLAVTLLYTTSVGKGIIDLIQGNEILKMIYECNPLLKLTALVR